MQRKKQNALHICARYICIEFIVSTGVLYGNQDIVQVPTDFIQQNNNNKPSEE